jgi:hypothetical protein
MVTTYLDSRIDYRIANPDDVPSGNAITAQRRRIFRLSPRSCRDAMHRVSMGGLKARNLLAQGNALWHAIDDQLPKPQRGGIRIISFDFALSGLSGLGVCATFIPQDVARRVCCGDAMHRVSTAHTPCTVDYALSGLSGLDRQVIFFYT